MNEMTRALDAIQRGDSSADTQLLTLVYAELRRLARAKMAREQPGHTLQPTALVHEAWLRLGDQRFENRVHFSAQPPRPCDAFWSSPPRKHAARRGGGERGSM